jgi:hypothetical protein
MAAPVYVTGNVPSAAEVNSWFVNVLFAQKPGDETISSNATLQDDNDLFVSVEANAKYHTIVSIRELSQPAAGFKTGWTGPAGYGFSGEARGPSGTAASLADTIGAEVGTGAHGIQFGGIATFNLPILFQGILTTAGTAGTFRLQWAQNTSNASGTTVKGGGFMLLRRVS